MKLILIIVIIFAANTYKASLPALDLHSHRVEQLNKLEAEIYK